MQRRRRVRKVSSGSHSLLSLLRKDLRDGSLQSFLGGSSYVSNPPAAAPDPFLSSLICSLPVAEPSKDFHSDSSDKTFLLNKFRDEKTLERYVTSSFVLSAASLHSLFAMILCIWSVDDSFPHSIFCPVHLHSTPFCYQSMNRNCKALHLYPCCWSCSRLSSMVIWFTFRWIAYPPSFPPPLFCC
jgi:hypothetical protein